MLSILQQKENNKAGFTLIELLVVVSIIGFLATLIVISLKDTRVKSFDTRRIADVNDIQKALELYSAGATSYPAGTNLVLGSGSAQCLSDNGFTATCPAGVKVYMGIVPANPGSGGADYVYSSVAGGLSFTLDFRIETTISDVTAGDHTLTPSGIQ